MDESPGLWYGYTRASTGKQEKSPEMQADMIRERVERDKGEQGEIFEDAATSGRKTAFLERKGAKRLVDTLREGDTLAIWKLDRLGRKTLDILQMIEFFGKRGVRLVVLDHGGSELDLSTAGGRVIVQVLAVFAEYECNLGRERTVEAIRWRKDSGKIYHNNPPLGYVLVPRIKKGSEKREPYFRWNQLLAECIEEAYQRCYLGGLSQQAMSDSFNRKRRTTVTGGRWSQSQVSRVIRYYHKMRIEKRAMFRGEIISPNDAPPLLVSPSSVACPPQDA